MGGKWLALLKEIAPRVNRVAFLFNPATAPYAEVLPEPLQGRRCVPRSGGDRSPCSRHVRTRIRHCRTGTRAEWRPRRDDGFILTVHRVEIISLAARYRLPAVYPFRYFTEIGGLLSYGSDQIDNLRRAATYADRILKGAKPSELPVQAPVKFELMINLKTAKALGLDVPMSLQQRADEVIE